MCLFLFDFIGHMECPNKHCGWYATLLMDISSVYNYLFLMVRPASQRGEWNDLNKHFGWYDAYLMVISWLNIYLGDKMEF